MSEPDPTKADRIWCVVWSCPNVRMIFTRAGNGPEAIEKTRPIAKAYAVEKKCQLDPEFSMASPIRLALEDSFLDRVINDALEYEAIMFRMRVAHGGQLFPDPSGQPDTPLAG